MARRRRWTTATALTALAGLASVIGAYAESNAAPETVGTIEAKDKRGFVVTYFQTAHSFALTKNGDDCPAGFTPGLQEVVLDSLPAGRLKDHLAKSLPDRISWAIRSSDPHMCLNPTDFRTPDVREVQSKLAYGVNLDGVATEDDPGTRSSCAHRKFRTTAGDLVDNQFYRAFGCVHAFNGNVAYGGNLIEDQHHAGRKDGEMTIVIELTGVTDDQNSDTVAVGFYSSPDPTPYDGQGRPMQKASLSVTDDPHYRTTAHGRIVNGVLTTDPVDVHFYFNAVAAHKDSEEYFIRAARLRLELHPDGTAKGTLAGYWDVEKAYNTLFAHSFPRDLLSAASFGYTCPAAYAALHKYADGIKDPRTGACSGISTIYDVEATQAFVIHPHETAERKTAALTPSAER
jgi:hypothetical protein